MEQLSSFLITLDGFLGSAQYFPILLLGVGIFFTIYLGFPQVRYFRHAWRILAGRYDDKDAPGDTTHFQALATALSGTVGTGNIGGVALALHVGGPAALFWMWATALFGMTTKFVEVLISYKYRVVDEEGHMAGGPMYYMDRGMNMRWLAILFAVACVATSFGTGSMPQANNIAQAMDATFGLSPYWTGGVLAVALGLVIIGGIKRIAAVTSKLVPFMAAAYGIGALAVIVSNLEFVGPAFVSVFRDAFSGSAAAGGFLGASFAYAFNRGVNRGLFSNEAGQGSAPIAHASAKGREPVSEGFVAILEPFIDTILICTLTGLVILSSGVWNEKFPNDFQDSDTIILAGDLTDSDAQHVTALSAFLTDQPSSVQRYSGTIEVQNGEATHEGFTILHARSVAENVTYHIGQNRRFTGEVMVRDGRIAEPDVYLRGESLIHSAALTVEAFNRSFLGSIGPYIVAFGLMLFAFSTALAWSYYGDRSMTFLFGTKSIMPYRLVYVVGFFLAAIADTTLIWQIAAITMVVMTLPNLLGLMVMRKEIRQEIRNYWTGFSKAHPDAPNPAPKDTG
ncbi:MAG: sodium:alanine symporter family protein [Pseudomonadales bacterium]|nr:sodium:alanine symporter family protein [Pseudomonadales bacterium]